MRRGGTVSFSGAGVNAPGSVEPPENRRSAACVSRSVR